ncbi:MAG: hypothetical protein CYG59_10825 [Chloroflexi bacterium]|nr:MAG: hypothetical protein CYG59_10825 [Chloroflexota bacterium]
MSELACSSISHPDVSVIIVSRNTQDYLRRSIESIQLGFQRYTVEIIVVDNASTDGTVEYVRSLPNVRLIANQTNTGFAEANNQAFKIARGEHYFLLNSDAFMHQSCGDILLDFMRKHSRAGLIVPTFEYVGGRWQPSFGSFPTVSRALQALLGIENVQILVYRLLDKYHRRLLRPKRVDYGEGAGLLIRGEVLREIGGISTDYFFYSEDVDFNLQAARAGWQTWWVPQARLTHVRGGSLSQKDFEAGLHMKFRSSMKLLLRHYSKRQVRLTYFLRFCYHQRVLWSLKLLALLPGTSRFMRYRLDKYRIVRDLYLTYLPARRFYSYIEETQG